MATHGLQTGFETSSMVGMALEVSCLFSVVATPATEVKTAANVRGRTMVEYILSETESGEN
jgi:hypothetical protein